MNTIAIDCGASFVKGALVKEGKIICRSEKSSPRVHGDESVFEPVQVTELVSMVREMIAELGAGEKEVRLCISNEMHGFLLADADGIPYTDYISWQKEYGAVEIDGVSSFAELREKSGSLDVWKGGMGLRAGLPSCNLLYLVRKGYLDMSKQLFFYTLGDYLIRELSGQPPVCHPTNAAATGLFDLTENVWNWKLIGYICQDRICFPQVGGGILEFAVGNLKVYCLPAIGDQQAALLGAGLESEDELSFNLGTGAQVSVLAKKVEFSESYQIRPYFHNMYLKTVPHLPSGRALNVYFRFFKDVLDVFGMDADDDKIWDTLLREAERGEAGKLVCDLSFFGNAVTDHVVGSIGNIGEYSLTVGSLMRAVLDRMAANFIDVVGVLGKDFGNIKKLIFSGGISRKVGYITRRIRDAFGENVAYSVAEDETLIGLLKYGELSESMLSV